MSAAPRSSASRLRSILGGSAGNLVEWYDWYAYSAFALYFAPSIFPAQDRTAQLLSAAMIFAVGFVMRPLGAWATGLYADRHGRKRALTLSVTLMCAGSMLIAVTPAYATIGAGSPLLLVLARILQGVGTGVATGTLSLSEMAGRERRGFFSSFQYVTLIAGQLVALCLLLLLQAVLTGRQLESWGWRIPFALGGLLAVAVFILRRNLAETAAFAKVGEAQAPASSGMRLLRRYPRQVMTVMLMTTGGTLAFYAYSTYMQKFLVNTAGFGRETATAVMASALFLYMLLQPVAGAISDRIGRKPLLVAFGIAGVALTVPIFTALETVRSAFGAFLLVVTALAIVTGYTAINAVVKAELFPADIRTLGVALPYALANALFGGTAEYVALYLKDAGVERGFYWYVTAMIGLSLIAYLRMPETRTDSLIDRD